jgi:hypothetical protein
MQKTNNELDSTTMWLLSSIPKYNHYSLEAILDPDINMLSLKINCHDEERGPIVKQCHSNLSFLDNQEFFEEKDKILAYLIQNNK